MPRPIVPLAPAVLAGVLALAACGEARPVAGEADAARCSACHGDAANAPALSGAHARHLDPGALAGAISCGECHLVPSTLDSAGHMDGRVDVVFGDRAGGEAARWDGERGTCAVHCHGVSLGGGPAASPAWRAAGVAQLACGSCHGAPPPAPHPASESCASCHPATVAGDGAIVAGGAHVNGRVDVAGGAASCGSCHSIPPPAPHAASTSCGSCHPGYGSTTVNAATHRNGRVDVTSQACGSCHSIPPSSGEHREHVEEGVSCGSCHPGASGTSGGPGHMNGRVNVAAPGWNPSSVSCANACHDGDDERWFD